MADFVTSLKEWQDLAGATLGGLISLLVALIVAYIPIRREDLTAAMLVAANLVAARARQVTLRDLARSTSITQDDYPYWLAEKLLQSRPKLSTTYDSASMRIMSLDAHLASHLTLFEVTIKEMDEKLERLALDFDAARRKEPKPRSVDSVKADSRLLADELDALAKHASCAEKLITHLILSKSRRLNKLRRVFGLSAEEKKCLAALK
jgi:hypothetical protein